MNSGKEVLGEVGSVGVIIWVAVDSSFKLRIIIIEDFKNR